MAPVAELRPGGRSASAERGDDEGGPGDTPASTAWLRSGRGTGYEADRDRLVTPPEGDSVKRITVAVTEKRTKAEIDGLVAALKACV